MLDSVRLCEKSTVWRLVANITRMSKQDNCDEDNHNQSLCVRLMQHKLHENDFPMISFVPCLSPRRCEERSQEFLPNSAKNMCKEELKFYANSQEKGSNLCKKSVQIWTRKTMQTGPNSVQIAPKLGLKRGSVRPQNMAKPSPEMSPAQTQLRAQVGSLLQILCTYRYNREWGRFWCLYRTVILKKRRLIGVKFHDDRWHQAAAFGGVLVQVKPYCMAGWITLEVV